MQKKCYWKPCGKNSYCRDFVQNTNTALFCQSIYLYYSGWSLANLVSLAYSSEWEVKICFLRAKKKLRQPSKGFWLSIIEHNNFEISASKFCAHYVWHFKCAKLKSKFFVGKLTIHDEHKKSFFNSLFWFYLSEICFLFALQKLEIPNFWKFCRPIFLKSQKFEIANFFHDKK